MPAKPTLRFPVFSAAELAEYFNPLVECVTEETLKKPTMHVAMAVYQHVAESILNVKYGRFSSSPQLQEALEEVVDRVTDHSELLRDALPFVSFYRELYRLLFICGIEDFCIKDLLRPEPARFRAILSAFCNFGRFHDANFSLCQSLATESEELANRRMELVQQTTVLAEELQALQMQRAEEEGPAEQQRDECALRAVQLKELKQRGDLANAELSQLKQAKSDTQDLLHENTLRLERTKQESVRLNGRIVRNPEEIKKSIVDMSANLQALKASVAEMERTCREMDGKVESLGVVEQDLISGIDLLASCDAEYRALHAAQSAATTAKDAVDRKQSELRELHAKEQQLQRQVTHHEEKMRRLAQQTAVKRQALDGKLSKLRGDWEEIGVEREGLTEQLRRNDVATSETKHKIQELKDGFDEDVSAFTAEWNSMSDHVVEYMGDLRRAMTSSGAMSVAAL